MRTLILMRHAEAAHDGGGGDRDRPLTPFGRSQAADMGARLRRLGIQQVLVSDARRAVETLAELGLEAHTETMAALYTGDADTYVQRIGEVPDDVDVVLVVGHAMAIPVLASRLTYATDHRAADELRCAFATAEASLFTFEGPWAGLLDDPTLRPGVLS